MNATESALEDWVGGWDLVGALPAPYPWALGRLGRYHWFHQANRAMSHRRREIVGPPRGVIVLAAALATLVVGFGAVRNLTGAVLLPTLEDAEIAGFVIGLAGALGTWAGIAYLRRRA
jgi:hypothetical protein